SEGLGTAIDNDDQILHIQLGAKQAPQSLAAVEDVHAADRAFRSFRIKLANYLNIALPRNNIELPNGQHIKLVLADMLSWWWCCCGNTNGDVVMATRGCGVDDSGARGIGWAKQCEEPKKRGGPRVAMSSAADHGWL
ncbi:hypothetical protein BJ138DRAFT_1211617, partial [Hygrophoropsis aurantiaca]